MTIITMGLEMETGDQRRRKRMEADEHRGRKERRILPPINNPSFLGRDDLGADNKFF